MSKSRTIKQTGDSLDIKIQRKCLVLTLRSNASTNASEMAPSIQNRLQGN